MTKIINWIYSFVNVVTPGPGGGEGWGRQTLKHSSKLSVC